MSINASLIIDNIFLLPFYLFLATFSFEFYAIKYSATHKTISNFRDRLINPLRWIFSDNSVFLKFILFRKDEKDFTEHLNNTNLRKSRYGRLLFFIFCIVIAFSNVANIFRGNDIVDVLVSTGLAFISVICTYLCFNFGKELGEVA